MMRNGQNKRMRGRNRNNNHSHNQNRGGHHHHNPLTRVYESNGPDVKIRGTAHHIAEKYLQLARDATSVGDHVTAEAHHQHAEHYFRLIAAAQEQFRQQNPHYQPQAAQTTEENRDGVTYEGSEDANQASPQNPQNFGSPQNPQSFGNPQNPQPQQQPYGGPQPYSNPQPQYARPQPQQQPHQPQPQQQQPQSNYGGNEVGGLPSFITGGQPQQAPQHGPNGHDGQGDRFPMHRRRRRHRGPHQQQQTDMRGGDAPPDDQRPGND